MPELKIGSQGAEVYRFYDYFTKYSASYSFLLGKRDGYYGGDEAKFTDELQRRLGLPRNGRFGDLEAARTGYRWTGTTTPPVVKFTRDYIYTAPGSGADANIGPSWEVGEWVRQNMNFHHVPTIFPKGGYLGLMGGDPSYSYNDVIYAEYKALEANLRENWDIRDKNDGLKLWFSGYSQSADGMEDALEILFGDGGFVDVRGETHGPGEFREFRKNIKGVINFGNPSRQAGSNNGAGSFVPPGWGISRKIRPAWLTKLVASVTVTGDFYACTTDSIRPPFYKIIVESEMSLPFFVHVLNVAVPVITQTIPIFGGLLGPLAPAIVGSMTGLSGMLPLLGGLMGQQTSNSGDAELDKELINMLSINGIISHIPDLIGLVGSLPGIQYHGEYHLPKPEFNGRTGIQVGCDIIRTFN